MAATAAAPGAWTVGGTVGATVIWPAMAGLVACGAGLSRGAAGLAADAGGPWCPALMKVPETKAASTKTAAAAAIVSQPWRNSR